MMADSSDREPPREGEAPPPAGEDEQKLPDFEQSLTEVQQIIDQMESGEVSLEKSLEHYARGMNLIQHCNRILERAEDRFRKLTINEQSGRVEADEPDDTLTDD